MNTGKFIKPRSEFEKGPQGDALFNAPENWVQETSVTANPAKQEKLKARLIAIDGDAEDNTKPIIKTSVDASGAPVENAFFNLVLENNRGEVITRSVNASFFAKLRSRLKEGKVYEFSFDVRVKGKTTYLPKGATTPVLHTSSGETLTGFMPISETAFGEVPNMEPIQAQADLIQQYGAEFQNTTFKLIELATTAKERQAAALRAAMANA